MRKAASRFAYAWACVNGGGIVKLQYRNTGPHDGPPDLIVVIFAAKHQSSSNNEKIWRLTSHRQPFTPWAYQDRTSGLPHPWVVALSDQADATRVLDIVEGYVEAASAGVALWAEGRDDDTTIVGGGMQVDQSNQARQVSTRQLSTQLVRRAASLAASDLIAGRSSGNSRLNVGTASTAACLIDGTESIEGNIRVTVQAFGSRRSSQGQTGRKCLQSSTLLSLLSRLGCYDTVPQQVSSSTRSPLSSSRWRYSCPRLRRNGGTGP